MKRIIISMLTIIIMISSVCVAEQEIPENWTDIWIFCRPDGEVSVRDIASKKGKVIREYYVGDHLYTDGKIRNGWVRVHGLGTEADVGWIYSGYIVYNKPYEINDYHYIRTEDRKVKVRKYIDGPRIKWAYDDDYVKVYYVSKDWCVTNKGYIMTEFIDIDYEWYAKRDNKE